MEDYKLNPSEELIHEEKSNPKLKIKAKNRYAIILGLFLIIIGGLFFIPAKNDSIMYAPAYISLIIGVVFIIYYFVKISGDYSDKIKTYLITNTRVVVLQDGKEIKSILLSKIKSLDIDKISGKAGDVVINKRPMDPARAQALERKGEVGPFYSKETIVLENIDNAAGFIEKIK